MEKQFYERKKIKLIFTHDKQYFLIEIKYNTTPINSNKHTGTAKSVKIL